MLERVVVGSSSSTGFPPRDLLHPRHRPPPFRTRPLARAGRTAVDRAVSLRRRLNPERSFSVHVMSRPYQSRLSCQFLSTCLCLYGTGTSSVCLSTLFCVFSSLFLFRFLFYFFRLPFYLRVFFLIKLYRRIPAKSEPPDLLSLWSAVCPWLSILDPDSVQGSSGSGFEIRIRIQGLEKIFKMLTHYRTFCLNIWFKKRISQWKEMSFNDFFWRICIKKKLY